MAERLGVLVGLEQEAVQAVRPEVQSIYRAVNTWYRPWAETYSREIQGEALVVKSQPVAYPSWWTAEFPSTELHEIAAGLDYAEG